MTIPKNVMQISAIIEDAADRAFANSALEPNDFETEHIMEITSALRGAAALSLDLYASRKESGQLH